jgi:hypothetical protein
MRRCFSSARRYFGQERVVPRDERRDFVWKVRPEEFESHGLGTAVGTIWLVVMPRRKSVSDELKVIEVAAMHFGLAER